MDRKGDKNIHSFVVILEHIVVDSNTFDLSAGHDSLLFVRGLVDHLRSDMLVGPLGGLVFTLSELMTARTLPYGCPD